MNLVVFSALLVVSCSAAPRGFSLAAMQKLASKAKVTRSGAVCALSGEEVTTLGELTSLHVVSLTTHPLDADLLIYADETALYEFNKLTGTSRMVAGSESEGLTSSRMSRDGEGTDSRFKYITKIQARASGVYIFDYDSLRIYNPEDQSVSTVRSLFDAAWMEEGPVVGVVSQAEDEVYFSTINGYGHFVLRLALPDGDLSTAELVTAGPSLISSLELSGDGRFLLLGDVDAKSVIRVTIGEPNSEEFVDTGRKPFYPGAIASLSDAEVLVVNTRAKSLEVYDVTELGETADACEGECRSEISGPLDVAIDNQNQVVYVLDTMSHPTLPTYKYTIKAISKSSNAQAQEEQTLGKDEYAELIKYLQILIKRMDIVQ